jgi:hypothetical protein
MELALQTVGELADSSLVKENGLRSYLIRITGRFLFCPDDAKNARQQTPPETAQHTVTTRDGRWYGTGHTECSDAPPQSDNSGHRKINTAHDTEKHAD